MKKLLCILLLLPAIAAAQELKPGFGIQAGLMVPVGGEFKEFYSAGPEFGGELILRGKQVELGLGVGVYLKKGDSAQFAYHPATSQLFLGRGSGDLDGRLIPILATIRYKLTPPEARTAAYLGFGGGAYNFHEGYPNGTSVNKTGFGGHAVTGFESFLGQNNARFFIEGRTSYANMGRNDFTTLSLSLTSFTVSAGVRF